MASVTPQPSENGTYSLGYPLQITHMQGRGFTSSMRRVRSWVCFTGSSGRTQLHHGPTELSELFDRAVDSYLVLVDERSDGAAG